MGAAIALTGAPAGTAGRGTRRAVAASFAAALALAAYANAAVSAEPLVARVACRDGVPNGAYEVRMPDGQLRIVGALAKGRRTGTFLFWTADGARVALIPYEDEVKVGTVALWYPPAIPRDEPRRRLESAYTAGVLNGITRSWHANGRRRAEYRYEHGELATAQAWSEAGEPLAEPAARRLAERDRAAEARVYEELERTVAENAPRCN